MNRADQNAARFPNGIPELWCPMITHFRAPATPDTERVHALMAHIAPWVHGILIPGSTGEGWDMSDRDILRLLEVVLERASALGQHVLIGALKPTAAEMNTSIDATLALLSSLTGRADPSAAMDAAGVAGFTVCPPTGADLPQSALQQGLEDVLARGLPTAVYQLPQVTRNELMPETVEDLAHRYQNFFLFKDTSGEDRVAKAALDYQDVFFVRGAEGGYSRWPRSAGGLYDGFLLSTANPFSAELGEMLAHLHAGRQEEADRISDRIARCVEIMFPLAGAVKAGNAFANANKVFDHLRAWGPEAEAVEPPML
ncbi:MAG: dihydrodipicolinate synthase family protein, partial [Spirochaetaceae bacterium]